jgi:cytochrome c553
MGRFDLRLLLISFSCLVAFVLLPFAQNANQSTPYWAYAVNPPDLAPSAKKPDPTPKHLPDSKAAYTAAQIGDLFGVPDWHPESHPPMPEIVAHGRKPDIFACAYCHLPNGQGRPENASLNGLPAGYIEAQMRDFRSEVRKCSEPTFLPAFNMNLHEALATDAEIRSAAEYFENLPRKPWLRIVETGTVPKTHVSGWMLVPDTPAASEPIGQRIIETPENPARTDLRDDTSGFVAYVPRGSLQRGKLLVTTGVSGTTVPCAKCHGPGLRGSGAIPRIAGRSPSYIVRQLYDIKAGTRSGTASRQMRPTVQKLTLDDMIAIAGYVASLRP